MRENPGQSENAVQSQKVLRGGNVVKRQCRSIGELAIILGCSERFLWDQVKQGEINTFRLGRRVFVHDSEIERIIQAGPDNDNKTQCNG